MAVTERYIGIGGWVILLRVLGFVLLLTAIAKVVSSFGDATKLSGMDPVFHIRIRLVLRLVAFVEIAVAMYCLLGRRLRVQGAILAWIATTFVLYRIGLSWVGFDRNCNCLGDVTEKLGVPEETADFAMKIIIAIMFSTGFGILLFGKDGGKSQRAVTPAQP